MNRRHVKNFSVIDIIYLVSSRSFHLNRVDHIHSKKIFNNVILKFSICNTCIDKLPAKKRIR